MSVTGVKVDVELKCCVISILFHSQQILYGFERLLLLMLLQKFVSDRLKVER